ncbi:hypothetical protein ACFLYM_00485 [Chloroflexota bacterium]
MLLVEFKGNEMINIKPKLFTGIKLLIICALIVPAVFTSGSNSALAAPGILRWDRIDTPGSVANKNDVTTPSEVNRIAMGFDGKTFYSVDIANPNNATGADALYKSTDSGISWNDSIGQNLYQTMTPAEQANFRIWNVAIAPDNTGIIAAVINTNASTLPGSVWISIDGGDNWQNTNCPAVSNISAIDIAASSSGYDIAIGTRNGAGGGTIFNFNTSNNGNWAAQGLNGDIMALKCSPDYNNDATISAVYSNLNGTFINAGIHDFEANTTNWNSIYGSAPPEITTAGAGTSATINQIITADLELPSDFSGQAPSFRRYYICIDALNINAGIYRLDDTFCYWLMPATDTKRISSIAYYGSYTAGKLLAGEVLGSPCSAEVMTWFTDAPTTCPGTCWYQSVKPPTGAAGTDNCTGSGYGNAQVAWAPDGLTCYTATSSSGVLIPGVNWPNPYVTGNDLDESAFSLTLNNGETWNQLSLIDTRINLFTDIAPAPDCSNLYLASTNNGTNCSGFDSLWRSNISPIGFTWERILCKANTGQPCAAGQSDDAIIRLAGDRIDGQYVFWAARGTRAIWWSPDYGDYWEEISPRFNVQDMAAEDSTTLYILNAAGQIQKFTRPGNAWTSSATISTGLDTGYSIATAYTGVTPDNYKGDIIVGGTGAGNFDVAYSMDGGDTFNIITKLLPTRGNTLVVATSGYRSDGGIMAINFGGMYNWSIYEGEEAAWEAWWGGPPWPSPVTGLAISRNYYFYYSTPASLWAPATPYVRWAAANAGLDPAVSLGAAATPNTRLRICGGMEYGQPISIWVIDQRPYNPPAGGVWCYLDCLAWEGPAPTSPITLEPVSFDPVSGRAGQIHLTWDPECLSRGYRVQMAKDIDFNLLIVDIGSTWGGPFYTPHDLDTPVMIIPPGGGAIADSNNNIWNVPALEAGHTYYWRVRVQDVTTGDNIDSPWSWRESFMVRQGLRVTTPYYGPQLLAPDSGCGCRCDAPVCFSWSPFKETTAYQFELSEYADISSPLISTAISNGATAFQYNGTLNCNTNYFWRVRAIEPWPSDWSAVFSFMIQAEELPPPPVQPAPEPATPLWVWMVISVITLLAITVLGFLIRDRYYS